MAQTGRARCAAIDPQILVTLWQPVIELRWPVGMNRVRLTRIRQARRTATLLDPRSESPGESMSRVVFADHRIPAPEPQFRVYDRAGRLAGPLRLRLGGAAHRR